MTPRVLALLACACLVVTSGRAAAHDVLPSALDLSLARGGVEATLHLPVDQLGLALSTAWDDASLVDLARTPERVDAALEARLAALVTRELTVTDERGTAWRAQVERMRWTSENEVAFVVIDVTFTPPDDHVARSLVIRNEVIGREVVSHRTLVTLLCDFERADLRPRILGTLRVTGRTFTLDRSDASLGRGAWAMLELGARHIAEGLDHLLFLFVLLLAAPLARSRRRASRWGAPRTQRETGLALLRLVTAFTIGHSLTLALSVLGWLRVPSTPVEILVGLSLAIGALHALRPLFAGHEPLVAGVFGLVHGLAFASTLEGFGLRGSALAIAIGAFDLGIEMVQLAVVVAFAPLLVVAARSPSYTSLRVACASFAIVSSAAWMLERIEGTSNTISAQLAQASESPLVLGVASWIALAAWASASAAWARSAERSRTTSHGDPVTVVD